MIRTAQSCASDNLNVVCGKCHSLAKFGTEQHHHHQADSAGALCVNCHMPTHTYMVVDVRRDHSLRVPRPDLIAGLRHAERLQSVPQRQVDSTGRAEAVVKWYGPNRRQEAHFVEAIDAGRRGLPSAQKALTALITDSQKPAIARATALSLLPEYLTPSALPAVQSCAQRNDALVRREAVQRA